MSSRANIRGFEFHKAGLNSAGNYMMSGVPAISGAIAVPAANDGDGTGLQLSFPTVTRTLTVRNDGGNVLRVGFAASAMSGAAGQDGTQYFTLPSSGSFSEDWRVTDVWLMSDDDTVAKATIIASLTGIPVSEIKNNWSGSSEVDGWLK
jgi:hypothetical protein